MNTSASEYKLVILSNLLSGLVEKLDKRTATRVSPSHEEGGFNGLHDLSPSDSDGDVREGVFDDPDPLDGLEALTHTQSNDQPAAATVGDDADFLKL